jgi:predicted nucleotidyltransferase component of viral defense system
MPPDSFLYERSDFKAVVETVADSEKINDPALVEKDYWIMHAVFGLKQLGFAFELKGGTSLSKGFGVIHRFSEDIDIRIESKSREAAAHRIETSVLREAAGQS